MTVERKPLSLERLLTHPAAWGLTSATPVQRAICRIADGEPLGELADDPDVRTLISCEPEAMPGTRPKELYLVAAIRGAKSMIAAVLGFSRAVTCDCSPLRDSDVPRVAILAPRIDLGDVIFKQHLLGTFARKPKLQALMIGNPNFSDRTFLIRHQTGRPIEIAVVATARAGATVAARWLAALIADEFARMGGGMGAAGGNAPGEESAVNFNDIRRTARERILPGGQIIGISSPWAPFGPAYDVVQNFYGKPSKAIVVLRATGPQLNPNYWTPARIAEVSAAPDGDVILQTDCWAQFADPRASFFTEEELRLVTRKSPFQRPKERGVVYFAFMDPATRRNAWTVVVLGAQYDENGEVALHVALAKQWLPTANKKLNPREVLMEIKAELDAYELNEVGTDQWAADFIETIGQLEGLIVTEHTCQGGESYRRYDDMRLMIRTGQLELSPQIELRRDLLALTRKVTREGFHIDPKQTADGRHADFAPALRGCVFLARQTGAWVHAMKKAQERLETGGTIFKAKEPGAQDETPRFDPMALQGPLGRGRDARAEADEKPSHLDGLFSSDSPQRARYCPHCKMFYARGCEKHGEAA